MADANPKSDLLQGTLDVLILKVVAFGPTLALLAPRRHSRWVPARQLPTDRGPRRVHALTVATPSRPNLTGQSVLSPAVSDA